MSLARYQTMRKFGRTSEPKGRTPSKRAKGALSFVVQFHRARSDHYDFRLELDGVLKSWAVPKGPSTDPADKRLAVQVEDHPLEYGKFEGTIPQGNYGAGTVKIWDHGTWAPDADANAGLSNGSLKFTLQGRRLKGRWALVRMHGRERSGKANWLLIKERSDRTAASSSKSQSSSRPRVSDPRGLKPPALGARHAPQPMSFTPQLCTLTTAVPGGPQWRHEIKFDGYRILACIVHGSVRLLTRNGKDWTHRFQQIADAVKARGWQWGILDGEAVAVNDQGASDFQILQNSIQEGGDVDYYVFDIPHWDRWDLTGCSLEARQAFLRNLLGDAESPIKFSQHLEGQGRAVMGEACKLGLEGIVSKRIDSLYTGGRTGDWVKIRCSNRQEMVIAGFTDPKRSREEFGALLIGYHSAPGELVYAGKVGTGFDVKTLHSLGRELKPLHIAASPFAKSPPVAIARSAHWVDPKLVAEIRFSEWTRDGRLRHPVFLGLRKDKKARDVVRERPVAVAAATSTAPPRAQGGVFKKTSAARARRAGAGEAEVSGIRVTHPDRLVYPDAGFTKLDIARYFENIAERIMPHIENRPLSVVRCPKGVGGSCFFNKHFDAAGMPGLRNVSIQDSKGVQPYLVVTDIRGLVYLVQMNVLELHTWGSTADDLDRPDRLVFDLDPGEDSTWKDVVYGATRTRDLLKRAGLDTFLKSTGGKGLHVVAPLKPAATWDKVKQFCRTVAATLAADEPDRFVDNMSKAKRRGRIFVDYLRNQRGATSIAAYSTRARAGAPISVPLSWKELAAFTPGRYTIARLPSARRDPWSSFWNADQALKVGR